MRGARVRNRRKTSRGWAGSALLSCGPYSSRRHLEYSAAPFRGITQQKEQSRCGGEGPVIRSSCGKVSARAQWRKSGRRSSRRKRAHLRTRVVQHSRWITVYLPAEGPENLTCLALTRKASRYTQPDIFFALAPFPSPQSTGVLLLRVWTF